MNARHQFSRLTEKHFLTFLIFLTISFYCSQAHSYPETQALETAIERTVTQTYNNSDYFLKGLVQKSVTTDNQRKEMGSGLEM